MDYLEIFFQTTLAFTGLLVMARLLGKQQVGQLTFFEYVAGITIGSIAANMASDISGRTTHHFMSLVFFVALTGLAQYTGLVSRTVRKVLDGEPTIIISNGKILEDNMKKMRYNLDELLQQLRQKDVFDLTQVEFALLELNGQLSVQLKSEYLPAKMKDLHLSSSYLGISSELVQDGEIIHQNLVQNNLDQQWLMDQLRAYGVTDIKQVVLASLATNGKLYIDLRGDHLEHATDPSDTFVQGKQQE